MILDADTQALAEAIFGPVRNPHSWPSPWITQANQTRPGSWLAPTQREKDWILEDIARHEPEARRGVVLHPVPDTADDDYTDIVQNLPTFGVSPDRVIGVSAFAQPDGLIRWVPVVRAPGAAPAHVLDALTHTLAAHRVDLYVTRLGLRRLLAEARESTAEALATGYIAEDQVKHVVQLAREGKEAEFRELVPMLGVPADLVDEMWTGLGKLVRKKTG